MAKPKFNFSIPVLTAAATRLHDALVDPLYAAEMTERLYAVTDTDTDNFTTRFLMQIGLVDDKVVEQRS